MTGVAVLPDIECTFPQEFPMTISPRSHVTILAPVFPRKSQDLTVHWTDDHDREPWQAQLSRSIAQSNWDAKHLPAAELIRGSDNGPVWPAELPDNSPLVCADPIHLRADRDSATLIPAAMLQLRDSEADALLESINEFLQADSLHFSRTESDRWFMSGKDGSALCSYPPSFLAHRNASAFLTDGDTSGSWRRLMTELQMLLHTHPVNREREQQGLLPINSIWFWGGALLQPVKLAAGITQQSVRLYADDKFAVALAAHLGMACEPLAAFDPNSDHPHSLLVDTRLVQALFAEDESSLNEAEHRIVDDWIAPLQARIEAGDAIELEILNEDGMQGRLDAGIVRAAAADARAVRVSQMSATSRLNEQLVGGVASLWKMLRDRLWNRLSGGM